MDTQTPLPLLGGLTPQQFMRRHWQKKPLLVRQAIPGFKPFLSAPELFELAAREEVESRLIVQQPIKSAAGRGKGQGGWQMKRGPFARRALPPLKQAGWTLLVQGVDLHHGPAHELMSQFRFIPDARLDDLMISLATEGGGVGPHFDSYDVFLFQASGSRRWRIGAQKDLSLQPDVPLKILRNFQPDQEFVLHAGDMLYLPPRFAHDGVAVDSAGLGGRPELCMTYSIGFRAPGEAELASALLQRLSDAVLDDSDAGTDRLYRDPAQPATRTPAQVPADLQTFAQAAMNRALKDPRRLACVLGEYLTEPKASVWFDPGEALVDGLGGKGVRLHERTRMLYDAHHVFINGEAYVARGADARLMRQLADERCLSARRLSAVSEGARALLGQWLSDGWVVLQPPE